MKKAVSVVLGALKDEQSEVRINAATLLVAADSKDMRVAEALRGALTDKSRGVRLNALWSLWVLRRKAPAKELEVLLSSEKESLRLDALEIAGLLETADPRVKSIAVRALKDPSGAVRLRAVSVLLLTGRKASELLPVVTGVLNDKQAHVRSFALTTLMSVGREAAPALPAVERRLADKVPWVRANAAQAHWKISGKPDRAVRVLLNMADTPGAGYPHIGARTLAQMGAAAKAAVPELERILAKPEKAADVVGAASAYLRITGSPKKVVPALIRALDFNLSNHVDEAIDMLAKIGPDAAAALPRLRNMADDSYQGRQVRKAIRKIEGTPEP